MPLPRVGTSDWDNLVKRYLACNKKERIALAKELGYKYTDSFYKIMRERGVDYLNSVPYEYCPFKGQQGDHAPSGVSLKAQSVEIEDRNIIDTCLNCELEECFYMNRKPRKENNLSVVRR